MKPAIMKIEACNGLTWENLQNKATQNETKQQGKLYTCLLIQNQMSEL